MHESEKGRTRKGIYVNKEREKGKKKTEEEKNVDNG
jgi:hypothetical protein